MVKGRDNAGLKQRDRSQMVAVVPQSFDIDYDFTVEDIVLMGRNPYLSYRDRESVEDYRGNFKGRYRGGFRPEN